MSKVWHGGKGSSARPIEDRKQFEDNWDRIFDKTTGKIHRDGFDRNTSDNQDENNVEENAL
jgi:hypothetical protein